MSEKGEYFEKFLVPKALKVQDELMGDPDVKIQGEAARDILDRSKEYGKKKESSMGTGNVFVLDSKLLTKAVNTLGGMFGVEEKVENLQIEDVEDVRVEDQEKPGEEEFVEFDEV